MTIVNQEKELVPLKDHPGLVHVDEIKGAKGKYKGLIFVPDADRASKRLYSEDRDYTCAGIDGKGYYFEYVGGKQSFGGYREEKI